MVGGFVVVQALYTLIENGEVVCLLRSSPWEVKLSLMISPNVVGKKESFLASGHQIAICLCQKTSCKGIATPLFKSSDECEDNVRGKNRHEKWSPDDDPKRCPDSVDNLALSLSPSSVIGEEQTRKQIWEAGERKSQIKLISRSRTLSLEIDSNWMTICTKSRVRVMWKEGGSGLEDRRLRSKSAKWQEAACQKTTKRHLHPDSDSGQQQKSCLSFRFWTSYRSLGLHTAGNNGGKVYWRSPSRASSHSQIMGWRSSNRTTAVWENLID